MAPPTLMTLPLEVRNMIWRFAVPDRLVRCSCTELEMLQTLSYIGTQTVDINHGCAEYQKASNDNRPLPDVAPLENPLLALISINRQAESEVIAISHQLLPTLAFCSSVCAAKFFRSNQHLIRPSSIYEINQQVRVEDFRSNADRQANDAKHYYARYAATRGYGSYKELIVARGYQRSSRIAQCMRAIGTGFKHNEGRFAFIAITAMDVKHVLCKGSCAINTGAPGCVAIGDSAAPHS